MFYQDVAVAVALIAGSNHTGCSNPEESMYTSSGLDQPPDIQSVSSCIIGGNSVGSCEIGCSPSVGCSQLIDSSAVAQGGVGFHVEFDSTTTGLSPASVNSLGSALGSSAPQAQHNTSHQNNGKHTKPHLSSKYVVRRHPLLDNAGRDKETCSLETPFK